MIAAHSTRENPKLEISFHSGQHFNFEITLSNDEIPEFPDCKKDEVIIDGVCVKNDVSNLSSYTMIDPGFRL